MFVSLPDPKGGNGLSKKYSSLGKTKITQAAGKKNFSLNIFRFVIAKRGVKIV